MIAVYNMVKIYSYEGLVLVLLSGAALIIPEVSLLRNEQVVPTLDSSISVSAIQGGGNVGNCLPNPTIIILVKARI